jgi:hypothetical protein
VCQLWSLQLRQNEIRYACVPESDHTYSYLLTFFFMGIISTWLISMNFLDHIPLVGVVLSNKWQHHSWSWNGKVWHAVALSIDIVYGCWRWEADLHWWTLCRVHDEGAAWQWVRQIKEAERGEVGLNNILQNGCACTAVLPSYLAEQQWTLTAIFKPKEVWMLIFIDLLKKKVLLLHDNSRPHTSFHVAEAITKFWWTVLPIQLTVLT